MNLRPTLCLGLAAAVICASASTTFARSRYYYGHRAPAYESQDYGYGYGDQYRRSSACIPICPGDDHPCDPIQYKQFDNRCDFDGF